MSINSNPAFSTMAEFSLPFVEFEVDADVSQGAHVAMALTPISFSVSGGVLGAASCDLNLPVLEMSVEGRINDEPNVFGELQLQLAPVDFEGFASVGVDGLAVLNFAPVDFSIDGSVRAAESSILNLTVEIFPAAASGNYQNFGARLKINGAIIPITSYDEDKSSTSAGKRVTCELARFDDISLLTTGATYLIEISELGAWEPVLQGTLSQKNFSLANEGNKPNDSVSVTFASEAEDRLAKTPKMNLVVFDSARLDIDPAEFEPVYDTEGRAYALEAKAVNNLSLYKLFNEIFVTRCGFSAVKTNLPDYPLRRADFNVSSNYLAGVAPHIGMFEAIPIDGDVLWIVEATNLLPAGFPAPRVLPASRIESISSDSQFEQIDGFELQFAQTETGDYFTVRTLPAREQLVRTRFGRTISRTVTETKIREYRSEFAPTVILREEVEQETVTKYGAESILPISIAVEKFTFDYLGRQKRSVKTVQKRLPDLSDGGLPAMQVVSEDELNYFYAVHPFFPSRQIKRRSELSVEGLIAIDSENQYLGGDFPQALALAHRAGNLNEAMQVQRALIKSATEDFRPLPDGTVKVFTTEIDHTPELVGKEAIETIGDGETRPGEISVSGAGKPGRMYVFADGDGETTGKRIEPFSVGELPLKYAIPLVRRRLKRKTSKNGKLSVSLIGWNLSLREGSTLTVQDREAGTVANILVEGYRRFAQKTEKGVDFGMILTATEI